MAIHASYVILFFILASLCLLLAEKATEYLLRRLDVTNIVLKEFPEIESSNLSKFQSFDSDLGWERQPDEKRKKDTEHQRPDKDDSDTVVYSTDGYSSRICEIKREEGDFAVATYGDSFCFCREVQDDETFQHYLSQELGVHVSNYGVGNYGLDQSILRMKRRFEDDPADYVVMALDDRVTINRILSAWKHYYEFGNIFAVKPRYKLVNGELELVPTPIESKDELLTLNRHKDYLRSNDYHYENWFLPHLMSRPYIKYWVQDRDHLPYATITILEYLVRNQSVLDPIHNQIKPLQHQWKHKRKSKQFAKENEYIEHLENQSMHLFCLLLSEFSAFVRSHGAVPIYLPIRDSKVYRSESNFIPIDESAIEQISQECPNLLIADPRDEIVDQTDSLAKLYVKKNPSRGHPSRLHNRLNAKYLANLIQEHREEVSV